MDFNTDMQYRLSYFFFFSAVSILLCNLCFDQVQGRLIQTICNLSHQSKSLEKVTVCIYPSPSHKDHCDYGHAALLLIQFCIT